MSTLPSFAEMPALLRYGVFAFVQSTPPASTVPRPSSPHGLWGFAVSTLPSFAGTPPARRPACLVPLTTGYTRSCLALISGVSVTSHTPSLGVRPRLSPHPGHDDWNPGQLGFQFICLQNACQDFQIQNSAIFLAFLKSPTLDILDKFGQCPKCPNTALPEILADRPSRLAFPLAL